MNNNDNEEQNKETIFILLYELLSFKGYSQAAFLLMFSNTIRKLENMIYLTLNRYVKNSNLNTNKRILKPKSSANLIKSKYKYLHLKCSPYIT